jgi:putative ABC transport system permease protein
MGIPLLSGREFAERDLKDAAEVVVINKAMADKFLPGEDPIGKRLQIYPLPPRWREVVGVIGDVKLLGLDAETNPAIYVPLAQSPYPAAMRNSFLVVRTTGGSDSVIAAIRSEMKNVDRGVPVANVRLLEDIVADSVAPRRLNMWLLVAFAGLASLLAAVGIYGVMAYSVTERTNEIGVRMALGASSTDVLRLVLLGGAKVTATGVVAGLAAAFAMTRVMSTLLYRVSPVDPLTFGAISTLIVLVSLLANYIPARKASRVDPMVALRAN